MCVVSRRITCSLPILLPFVCVFNGICKTAPLHTCAAFLSPKRTPHVLSFSSSSPSKRKKRELSDSNKMKGRSRLPAAERETETETAPMELKRTLESPSEAELVVKKSKFIARAESVASEKAALEFLENVSDLKASHNCWAFRGPDMNSYRFSDDGEPGGTAGRPILAAIDGEKLHNVVVVVTRYFGGIKLGTGGLVRAYGDAARACLKGASTEEIRPCVRVSISAPAALAGQVRNSIEVARSRSLFFPLRVCDETWEADGTSVVLSVELEEGGVEGFRALMQKLETQNCSVVVQVESEPG
mmetsp:Transcript_43010/g.84798  ORF Transcript_43010/g.84798 Transcript_43010/m.84798 type:complete len:301 (+) Transcript_43010:261-1163(+)